MVKVKSRISQKPGFIMGRYDERVGVASARTPGTFDDRRDAGAASVHVRRHVRSLSKMTPETEWFPPVAHAPRPRLAGAVSDLGLSPDADRAFNTVRIPQPGGSGHGTVIHSRAKSSDLPQEPGATNNVFRMGDDKPVDGKAQRSGTQAVARALDILDAIAERPMMLAELADRIGVSPPTCYRIANAMAQRGLLATSGRNGFALGPKAGELGVAYKKQVGDGPAG